MIRVFKTISDRVGDVFVQARVAQVFQALLSALCGRPEVAIVRVCSGVGCTFVLLPPSECVVCVHSVHHINTCVLVLVHT